MTDRPRSPETGDDTGMAYDREPTTGMPRWVTLVAIIVAVVALLAVVMLLIGARDGHGPGRHAPDGGVPGGHTPPAPHGVRQP